MIDLHSGFMKVDLDDEWQPDPNAAIRDFDANQTRNLQLIKRMA